MEKCQKGAGAVEGDKMNFLLTNKTRNNPPLSGLFLQKIKETVIGKKYNVSLVLVGETRMLAINKKYRRKSYATNVLSFEIDPEAGEIYICPAILHKQLKKFSMTYKKLFTFIFIHGLLHLRGLDHGPEMEKLEQKFLKNFS